MSAVSNFLLRRNDGQDLEIRRVHRHEIEPAMRLILAGSESETAVMEFLAMAVSRGLNLNAIWVAVDSSENVQWAMLPMPLAGRAMLLMTPPRLRPGLSSKHVTELVNGILADARQGGIHMVQALLDSGHRAVQRVLLEAGFSDIAELIYLSRQVRTPLAGRLLPDRYRIWNYNLATHTRFMKCIERTYIDSQDCPDLSGKRDMDDIVAGHKAAGEFDPNLWMLVSDNSENDVGVILLNRLQRREGYELVYIGLAPVARGLGLADAMLRTSYNILAGEGGGTIVTACDANNAPARAMYYRHGFGHLYSRFALVKQLEPLPPAPPRELPGLRLDIPEV